MALGGHNTGTMSISGSTLTGGENAGSGARTVLIEGLDENYDEVSETVNLNGTTNVNTTNSYTMIHTMTVKTAGSGATNAGEITATAASDATVTSTIAASAGRSTAAIYMVPRNKIAYVTAVHASIQKATDAEVDVDLRIKEYGETEVTRQTLAIESAAELTADHEFASPIAVAEKGLIKLRATTDTDNADIAGTIDLLVRG